MTSVMNDAERAYRNIVGDAAANAEEQRLLREANRRVQAATKFAKSCQGSQFLHNVTEDTFRAFGAPTTLPVRPAETPKPAKRPMPPSTVQEVDIDYSPADKRNIVIFYGIPACLACSLLTWAAIQFMSR